MSWEGEGSDGTIRAASDDPWLGRVLKSKYRLEHLLGAGGFGAVYAARQLLIGTWHAVKLLHAPTSSQPELVDRFREEARIGTRLRHPRIVTVTDFDVEGGSFFLVMDLIESVTLAQELRQTPDDVSHHIEPWARDIAAALDYAHAQGVIHRDLKPSNVLIRQQDQAALLTDFGISRWLHTVGVTQAGMAIGTHAYMSPEQCAGEERAIDARSDIYSFAALLFELECARPPFGTGREAMVAHLQRAIPSVRQFRADHPAADQLDAVFARGLAKSSDERPQSARELAEEFLGAKAGVSPQPRPVRALIPSLPRVAVLGAPSEKASPLALWRRWKFQITGAVAVLLIAGLGSAWWFLVRPHWAVPQARVRLTETHAPPIGVVPEPDVLSMVPSHFNVRDVEKFALDGGPIPERVVASEGPTTRSGSNVTRPMDLQVLRWDTSSSKWTVVFDAASVKPAGSDSAILPGNLYDTVVSFFSAKLDVTLGQQLVFETSVSGGSRPRIGIGVVDYLDGKFELVDWRTYDNDATIEAVGPPTAQLLRITSQWVTPLDAYCCPVRDYRIDINYAEGMARIRQDDRPRLGVDLVSLGDFANPIQRVGSVLGRSPADGVLAPGDTLIDVDGQRDDPKTPHAGVLDVIALRHPGDRITIHFDRAGTRREATVTLGSLNDPLEAAKPQPRSYFGLDAVDGSVGRRAGALIQKIAPGGPTASAGLTPGLLIANVGNLVITSASDLTLAEFQIPAGTPTKVMYLDSSGRAGEATITMGKPPAIDAKTAPSHLLTDDYIQTIEF